MSTAIRIAARSFVPALALSAAACAAGPPPAPPTNAAPAKTATAPPSGNAAASAPLPSASGVWLGTLRVGTKGLRLQLRLDLAKSPPDCALDSLDQNASGIACGDVQVAGNKVSIAVPSVSGSLAATLSDDGGTLTGTWTQGGSSLPLALTRQSKAIGGAVMDAALSPVDIGKLKEVLDSDLTAALEKGELAPGTDAGVVIGIVQHGERRVLAYGTAKADSLFEIGSVTKTMTGLLLAQMVEQKKVQLEEPVRALLPVGTFAAPAAGAEITLLDLSAQRSGLPRLPDNLKPADNTNPYADYDKKRLYAFVADHGLARPAKPAFEYSNLGVGLLGQALAERAKMSYADLLKKEITGPLGMRDTVVALTPALRARLIQGHDAAHKPARAWDFDALVGAGGVRSTAGDMLTYVEAELHPDRLPKSATATPEGKTLPAAIADSQTVRGEASGQMHIALNWMRVDASGRYWHDGGTGGYSSFVIFDRENDFGLVVLLNTASADGFAQALGAHVVQRLAGTPAVALGPSAP